MITEAEYNEILPHKADIQKFRRTGNCEGTAMDIADRIRQRLKMSGPVCYSCSASKADAMNDIYNLMVEYENANNTVR